MTSDEQMEAFLRTVTVEDAQRDRLAHLTDIEWRMYNRAGGTRANAR